MQNWHALIPHGHLVTLPLVKSLAGLIGSITDVKERFYVMS